MGNKKVYLQVKSIQWYESNKDKFGKVGNFTIQMSTYCGCFVAVDIDKISSQSPEPFRINLDNGANLWDLDMFESCIDKDDSDHKSSNESDSIETSDVDNVNNPKHYTSHPSGVECIEITQHHTFCVGNAIKYEWRAGLKKDLALSDIDKEIEDLEKARKYLGFEIKRLRNLKKKKLAIS